MTGPIDEQAIVVAVDGLSRHFGRTLALDSLSLRVPRGAVFGIVGANGAGKTTLIRHLLGLYRPQAGTVRVLGRDPVRDPVGVLGQVGYLSEENDLPPWMRVHELLRYIRAFYPGWDDGFAEDLRERFAIDPAKRMRDLSRGQKARTGLLIALAYRPELLLLDEPSTGLDPLAGATFWRRCCGRLPRRGGPCCSHRICSTRWSASPTTSQCSTRGVSSCRVRSTRCARPIAC